MTAAETGRHSMNRRVPMRTISKPVERKNTREEEEEPPKNSR
jgi:hypothetical protein